MWRGGVAVSEPVLVSYILGESISHIHSVSVHPSFGPRSSKEIFDGQVDPGKGLHLASRGVADQ